MDLLTTAKNIADRVEAESLTQNVPVAVTVIDIHGNVVLTHRMTGAPAFSLELAERKAYTSALIGFRTADLVPLARSRHRSLLNSGSATRTSTSSVTKSKCWGVRCSIPTWCISRESSHESSKPPRPS
jgi:uncharacterized protein GlcG (DUF336 family)